MRRHAKASSAGSTEHRANGLGRFFVAALVASLFVLVVMSAAAGAVVPRPFQENFGSAQEQTFTGPKALAFDQNAGELLVSSGAETGKISRFDEDGTPAAFSALGSNVIDGKKGPGGKSCAEEPASCDAVPGEKLAFVNKAELGIAIDESGGATDGNIYAVQPQARVVDIFAADGHYLGQLTGVGVSEFSEVCGLSVDQDGAVYVSDYETGVLKYVPSGNRPVNSDFTTTYSTVGQICSVAAGAGPTAGSLFVGKFFQPVFKISAATGALDYEFPSTATVTETVNPVSGHVFVAESGAVTEFDASGAAGTVEVSDVHPLNGVDGVAVNSAKDLVYVSTDTGQVEVFGPQPLVPGTTTGAVTNLSSTAATLNATVNPKGLEVESCAFEWGETAGPYEHTTPCAESSAQIGEGNAPVPVHADISGLSEAKLYHYRFVATNSNGPNEGEDRSFHTPAPPLIEGEAVQSGSRTEAQLVFKVNPRNFPTTYHIEYGLAGQPYEHSTAERGVGSDGVFHILTFNLEGLAPGKAYHWRLVATNLDPAFPGTGPTQGNEHFFHTVGTPISNANCPNQAFRYGAGAALPDCRAYEMVSPLEKNGGDVVGFLNFSEDLPSRASYDQAALDGNRITYTAGTPFADVISGRNANQYIADRGAEGWSTHSVNPPVNPYFEEGVNLIYSLGNPFRLFTPDLSEGWFQDESITPLTADAASGIANLYRDNLHGGYEALTNEQPAALPKGLFGYEYGFRIRGHSSDFSDVLFDTRAAVTPDAFPGGNNPYQTYESVDGDLHLVSVQPDGGATPGSSIPSALSSDGSRAFWTSLIASDLDGGIREGRGQGQVYLRLNPGEPQSAQTLGSARGAGVLSGGSNVITEVDTSSGAFAVGQEITALSAETYLPEGVKITAVGPDSLTLSANARRFTNKVTLVAWSECTEPEKACTIPVSATAPGGNFAEFQFANADGSKVWFSVPAEYTENGGTVTVHALYEFDLASRTSTLIAKESKGAVGISENGSRLYFVSAKDLAPGATAGQQNLYLREGGNETFIASLTTDDVEGAPTSIVGFKRHNGTRISADGNHLVFQSASKELAEKVADYDNTDAVSGQADREVYIYEVGGEMRCISCNPTGARPAGGQLERTFYLSGSPQEHTTTWGAAWIPAWENFFNAQRVLSADGGRVFFNSLDALVPGDTNGALDVYEWERPGSGDCSEANSTFSEQNGGCISLISSGQSPQLSEFVDATPNGNDVFFRTGASLDPRDPGLVDIYDARVNGGLILPPAPPNPCVGDSCQSPPPAPNDPTPASAGFRGAGDPTPRKAHKRSCRARKGGAKQSAKAKHKQAKRCKRAKRGAKR